MYKGGRLHPTHPAGFQALRVLVAQPKKAVSFLREHLRNLAASETFDDSPQRIARLIAGLGHNQFTARERATQELTKLGQRAAPALRKALEDGPTLEAKTRIESLLKDAVKPTLSAEWLRAERTLEALEQLGTDEVRQALAGLSREPRNRNWLSERVTEALRRLGK